MATKAIDVVTILKCLEQVENDLFKQKGKWEAKNNEQGMILEWLNQHRDLLKEIVGLKAIASNDVEILNGFLEAENFIPIFSPLEHDEFGVVSILDKLVEWLEGEAELVDIHAQNGNVYPGFEISESGVEMHRIFAGISGVLAEIKTKSDDTLWLFLPDVPIEWKLKDLEVFEIALGVMSGYSQFDPRHAGAEIPKIDFDIKSNIPFLVEMLGYDCKGDPWVLSRAFQQFKMRMNETGARVKVATSAQMRLTSSVPVAQKLVFDRPFFGWWTQKGLEGLPMAVFYADYDCWKEPDGSLEDL